MINNTYFNFKNLGFPKELTKFINDRCKVFKDNGKLLFVKTKYQDINTLQLLKFNSSSIVNTAIVLFPRVENEMVSLKNVDLIIKTDRAPSYDNFTKSRKTTVKYNYQDLENEFELNSMLDRIKESLDFTTQEKLPEIKYKCLPGADEYKPHPEYLTAAEIIDYEIIDANTIRLVLKGNSKTWMYDINARIIMAFTMINQIKGMWLIISPDGGHKVICDFFKDKLEII